MSDMILRNIMAKAQILLKEWKGNPSEDVSEIVKRYKGPEHAKIRQDLYSARRAGLADGVKFSVSRLMMVTLVPVFSDELPDTVAHTERLI